ncbi:stage II sporulation protein M [Clostridium chromiireducens]|uniref:stage II sporulation protein M n=1 Tax=Clostridium chromiireducens TaxID=225345 RepID=UPI003AF78EBF
MIKAFNNLFNVIKRNKTEIYLSAVIFLGTMLLGFLISKLNSSIYNNKLSNTYIQGFNTITIIENNLRAALYLIIGNITLGLSTIIILVFNGFSDGIMLGIHSKNLAIDTILVKTIFHGIFELPAIIFCGGIGLKTLSICIRTLRGKQSEIKTQIKDSLILFLLSFVLILIAGVIEGSIVPMLL